MALVTTSMDVENELRNPYSLVSQLAADIAAAYSLKQDILEHWYKSYVEQARMHDAQKMVDEFNDYRLLHNPKQPIRDEIPHILTSIEPQLRALADVQAEYHEAYDDYEEAIEFVTHTEKHVAKAHDQLVKAVMETVGSTTKEGVKPYVDMVLNAANELCDKHLAKKPLKSVKGNVAQRAKAFKEHFAHHFNWQHARERMMPVLAALPNVNQHGALAAIKPEHIFHPRPVPRSRVKHRHPHHHAVYSLMSAVNDIMATRAAHSHAIQRRDSAHENCLQVHGKLQLELANRFPTPSSVPVDYSSTQGR